MTGTQRIHAMPTALPTYIQISERLIREIAAGHLTDGARLPPERDMAASLHISVGTLRKALSDLEGKGLLRRVQGSGNYVQAKAGVASIYSFFRLELASGSGLPTAEILSIATLPKPADMPDVGVSETAHRIRRLRLLDGKAAALEEIWLDGARAPVLDAGDLSDSLYLYYRDRLGFVIGRVEDRVGVAPVPHWTVARFGPAAGTISAHIERLSWDATGAVAEYSRTWTDSTVARYVARNGRV